jgi:hypothetical protein
MKKIPITGKKVLLLLLAIVAIILLFFMKKAIVLILLLIIGFISNYLVLKIRVANLTANFFLSFLIIHFYGIPEFFIFLFVAEVLPRPFTGVPLPGAAYPGYITWIILAFISLNFSNFVLAGVILAAVRYFVNIALHMLAGTGFYMALIRNLSQLIINTACFLYIYPPLMSIF